LTGYLIRLIKSLGAYQLADVISKVMAVLLLPVYTHYLRTSDYGTVELIANTVIFVSIVVRFGMIESFLRFHFTDQDVARREALARKAIAFLLVSTTVACAPLVVFRGPLSRLVLGHHPDHVAYLYGVLGMWAFTNLELAYGLLRVDERLRAYATASVLNAALTIAGSLILVVGFGERARGLILANYGATVVVLLGVWWSMRRVLFGGRGFAGAAVERLGELLRFGLPTVPAEASVYALFLLDRYYLLYDKNRGAVGLYSFAVKLAGAIAFIVRAFQYAYPPLAYSVRDDAHAGRLYGLITTYYVLVCGWIVSGLTLEGRWVTRLLGHQRFFHAYRALPWVATGWALYGLWVVFLVVAGRAKVTTRNFLASLAGLAANVALLVLLVPPLGIAGAGLALCGAYVAMLSVMYRLTRDLFRVRFEGRRLGLLLLVFGGLSALGELLLPTHGIVGLVTRALVFLAIPGVLYAAGFAHPEELAQARALLGRLRSTGGGARRAGEPR
jgi:O-antigen/teichoic acid export membrane protein